MRKMSTGKCYLHSSLIHSQMSSYLVECRDCSFEKTMIGDEFAQWAADRHERDAKHTVTVRNVATGMTVYTSPE